ncbi:malonyl-[acyl-carrier protein] O-methyltransferase BioC [Paenibacillus kribbensis]|uniref:Malonyl-[acyl-carrier protein] O-methyltransferase n=1 Tax=Paenibacillus kribbensis TaxID=172713 RepID=A0A222WTL3_9BACL|nr:malonyl-ACP O-methyltransferase BioC [Paenibacillus kribbensis]ASR49315.1 malonyl-[acyl-carrier protein] O-methyltransferase BioC [Paenibacillus kribbensis]
MISRKAAIARQFNRSAAGLYDMHAHVQRTMADMLAEFLMQQANIDDSNKLGMLEIGCGTGILTEILVNRWPHSSITALDIAPAMLLAAEQRVLGTANPVGSNDRPSSDIRFLLADVEKWAAHTPASSFDLIVSSACFQWLSQPQQTLNYLYRLLRPGGILAFATFGPRTFHELHTAFEEVYRAKGMVAQRHGLTFQSANQWKDSLTTTGFSNIQYKCKLLTEEYASPRDFLLSVKALGASTSEAVISHSLGSRRLFTSLYKEYENRFSTPEGVAATYDIVFIQASTPE